MRKMTITILILSIFLLFFYGLVDMVAHHNGECYSWETADDGCDKKEICPPEFQIKGEALKICESGKLFYPGQLKRDPLNYLERRFSHEKS